MPIKPEIPDFGPARVLVAGDVMLDRYWRGPSERVSPEAPVPVVKVSGGEDRPGGAANVAVNVASLGGQTRVLGVVGDDANGAALTAGLDRAGIEHDLLSLPGRTTVTKLRVLSRNQQLLRLDFEDGLPAFDPAPLLARFAAHLPWCDLVVLSDYGKGALGASRRCIQLARAAGKAVLVDPKGQDFSHYRGATLLTPNLAEFQAVVGTCVDKAELAQRGRQLVHQLGLEALLVTRGEHGMSLLTAADGDEPLHIPARAREVFDVTGAGDTVIAVLAAALAAGQGFTQAAALANQAAGLVVAKLGAASVTADELRRSLAEPHETAVVTEPELARLVAAARERGEKIVLTNGCFDVLHAGHVRYLERARRLGDRLIVAVNDDASVRRLKGPSRPLNLLAARLQVLAGLSAVDWLVAFGEDTPERLICEILPDVLAKGGDYRPDAIAGADCVRRAGGEVAVLEFVGGFSTTQLIERIQNKFT